MKSVIVPAPGKIEIREVETPVINAYQVLVKTEMVALCNATDSKLIAGHFPGVDTYPLALGHENAGIVVAVGEKVRNFKVGDRAIGGLISDFGAQGINSGWGGFSEYVVVNDFEVLKEEGRRAQTQSFMWLFRSGEDGLPAIILYGYSPTRSGSHAKEFLEGYHGYLETDGYQGYNSLSDIKRCSCWAHIRRYFIDAVPKGKQYDYSQPAVQGVQYCNRLFAIEDSINKKYPGDYEKRKQLRLEKEKPVLEAFWLWLEHQKPVRNTRMDKAVNYVLNRRETAETYLEDGRCSFTNNLSENAIRPFAVGRKNWLFSDSVSGANASAVVYTMVEMAKAHDLNVYGYLKFLLDHRPTKEMTDDQLAELAPWSQKLQSIKNRM